MAHDSDPFARWEAGQQYATDLILHGVDALRAGRVPAADPAFIDAIGNILRDETLEPAFVAVAIGLPSADYLAERMEVVDPEGIHQAREALRRTVAERLAPDFARVADAKRTVAPYSPDAEQAGRRALGNAALAYLAALAEDDPAMLDRIVGRYRAADNMTDRMAALRLLVDIPGEAREAALADFFQRFRDDRLVIDKWLSLQAVSALPDTLDRVMALMRHPSFSMKNPNRVRSLIGAFTAANPFRYHAPDGSGYAFHADRTIELDAINPQVAARLLAPLGRWRRYDPARQDRMKAELERILAAPHLSRDVYEIASKSLGREA